VIENAETAGDVLLLFTEGPAGEQIKALHLTDGKEVWARRSFERLAGPDGKRLAGRSDIGGEVILLDIETGDETPCPLPAFDNVGNARFSADGTLWLQALVDPQPSWLPAWLAPTPAEHQRLFAINAGGRLTFEVAGRDLCGYLPFDDGSAVVTFHQHDGAHRISLHAARPWPVWPGVAGTLLGIAGAAILLAALWPRRSAPKPGVEVAP
jgi:hypothetical protein